MLSIVCLVLIGLDVKKNENPIIIYILFTAVGNVFFVFYNILTRLLPKRTNLVSVCFIYCLNVLFQLLIQIP